MKFETPSASLACCLRKRRVGEQLGCSPTLSATRRGYALSRYLNVPPFVCKPDEAGCDEQSCAQQAERDQVVSTAVRKLGRVRFFLSRGNRRRRNGRCRRVVRGLTRRRRNRRNILTRRRRFRRRMVLELHTPRIRIDLHLIRDRHRLTSRNIALPRQRRTIQHRRRNIRVTNLRRQRPINNLRMRKHI